LAYDDTICEYGLQKDWRKWTSSPIKVTVTQKGDSAVTQKGDSAVTQKGDSAVTQKGDSAVTQKGDSKIGLKSIPERDEES